jgi:hypothetical protein
MMLTFGEAMVTDWSDSTVHVPYLVEIERGDGEVRVYPAQFVTLTPDFVFVRDPAGGFQNLPARSVRSARVTVQDLPADLDVLRAEYPNAYQPWDEFVHADLRHVHESKRTLAATARRLSRPPQHLVTKAREFGYDLTDLLNPAEHESEPEPDRWTALRAKRRAEHNYLVILKPQLSDPYHILSRYRIDPQSVYRIAPWGFAATLTGLQFEEPLVVGDPALPDHPDIDRIEPDPDRLAPHFRAAQEQRVDGEYLVNVRPSSDPLTVAARAGVSPADVIKRFNLFCGDMTDAQIQALRQDPDVVDIVDNTTFESY